MEQYKILWDNALSELEKTIHALSYDTWIKTLTPVDIIENRLVLSAVSEMAANVVSSKYVKRIQEALSKAKTGLTDIDIIIGDSKEEFLKGRPAENAKVSFNTKYTFDNFVVGQSNKFVFAAAQAVADGADTKYNPLFIHGKTGLGKTHLMHAIGNYMLEKNPKLKIAYVTGEKFTNELIDSIRLGKERTNNVDFRSKYRNNDVLMVDDIQFIGNKPATQEEFFHTFNELYNMSKQIIVTSDRPPKEISLLEERLRTRFEWGLIADVQPPDFETKIAILQKKAEHNKVVINIDILNLIAGRVESDVRELEGLLNRVIFFASLTSNNITMDIAKEALKDYGDNSKEQITTDSIINAVCTYFNVSKADLCGKKKNKDIVDPRQACIYLMTEFLTIPLTAIGQIIGGRDHTTVIHARDKIAENVKNNDKAAVWVKDLRNLILKK